MFTQPIPVIHSRWHHFFADHKFSTKDFYELVERYIQASQINNIKTKRVSFKETGLFSSSREYLRVKRNEFMFDICAAPFSTGLYVSYWFGEETVWWKALMYRIPFIGPLLSKASELKTYYQLDTENMFREAIHSCVMQAIDDCTKDTSVRSLTETERKSLGRTVTAN